MSGEMVPPHGATSSADGDEPFHDVKSLAALSLQNSGDNAPDQENKVECIAPQVGDHCTVSTLPRQQNPGSLHHHHDFSRAAPFNSSFHAQQPNPPGLGKWQFIRGTPPPPASRLHLWGRGQILGRRVNDQHQTKDRRVSRFYEACSRIQCAINKVKTLSDAA